MNWFLIALMGPLLWALVNHVDKYIISRYFSGRGVGSLVMFTSASGLIISLIILACNHSALSLGVGNALIIAANGALLVAAFIPYLYALENEEASWTSTLFQLIPVFGYVLAWVFLGEQLAGRQLWGSALIIVAAIAISLDLSRRIAFKAKPFWLMILSSVMIAFNALIFKWVALDENFWGTAFWEYIGGAFFGLLLFTCIPLYRRQFIATIRRGKARILGVNMVAEFLNIGAKLAANFASLLAPLALVWVVNGFQPLIVFIYGVILTLFLPKFGQEDISRRTVLQKLTAIAVMLVGIWLLFV